MIKLPIPRLLGGKAEVDEAPASPFLREFMQDLVRRADDIRNGLVKPSVDNMLRVTHDGRMAGLDVRMVFPDPPEDPDCKIRRLATQVYETWDSSRDERLTQLIFCDIGVNPNRWGFSPYAEVRRILVEEMGVPPAEFAFAQEPASDRAKARQQAMVRAGIIRILMGSTQVMGEGTNCQTRLFFTHHLDVPLRPVDIEQRVGRMVRRGNRCRYVRERRYITSGSSDAFLWQINHNKIAMIAPLMMGDPSIRRTEDVDEIVLTYGELKAIASGNPKVMERATLEAEITRLGRLEGRHLDEQVATRSKLARLPREIEAARRLLAAMEEDYGHLRPFRGEAFRLRVEDRDVTERKEAAPLLRGALLNAYSEGRGEDELVPTRIGEFAGFALVASRSKCGRPFAVRAALERRMQYPIIVELADSTAAGNLQQLEGIPDRMKRALGEQREKLRRMESEHEQLAGIAEVPFAHAEELGAKRLRLRELEIELQVSDRGSRQDLGALEAAVLPDDADDPDGAAGEEPAAPEPEEVPA